MITENNKIYTYITWWWWWLQIRVHIRHLIRGKGQLASWCFSERFLPLLLTLSACLRNALFKIWTVRSGTPLENGWYGGTSVFLTPFREFLGNELRSVVRDNFFWQSICPKPQSHLINSDLSSCGSQVCHLYPLGMAVSQPKQVIAIFLCKINMHSLPYPSRPSPWVQCCTRGAFRTALATKCNFGLLLSLQQYQNVLRVFLAVCF